MLSACSLAVILLSATFTQDGTDFSLLASRTPVIAVGKIIDIGEPPATWSTGGFVFAQQVKYKVVAVLKGENIAQEVTVSHYIFKGSPSCDKNRPRLSPDIFTLGSEHILFLSPSESDEATTPFLDRFAETNTAHGAVPANENNLRDVKKVLRIADAPPRSGP
jgi:hypothetical protein